MPDLLTFTERGIYCAAANIYIDPWKKVNKALITHAHSDHARIGHKHYLAHKVTGPILKHRLGEINVQTVEYGEAIHINGVRFSFHPAGHVPGSSQIRVEHKGEVWVVSGDYKLTDDGLSTPFEPLKCNTFITECTFGLPVFKWADQENVLTGIADWWSRNREKGMASVLIAYSLGKAQRILTNLKVREGNIYTHGAIEKMNDLFRAEGFKLPKTTLVSRELARNVYKGSLIIAPPSAMGSSWMRKFQPYSLAIASGWMALRGARRRRAADRGFILSDHADWEGLNRAVSLTGADKIITTHGYTDIFTRWLNEKGFSATAAVTAFEGENIDRETEEDEK